MAWVPAEEVAAVAGALCFRSGCPFVTFIHSLSLAQAGKGRRKDIPRAGGRLRTWAGPRDSWADCGGWQGDWWVPLGASWRRAWPRGASARTPCASQPSKGGQGVDEVYDSQTLDRDTCMSSLVKEASSLASSWRYMHSGL